jgi:hypothetical protein
MAKEVADDDERAANERDIAGVRASKEEPADDEDEVVEPSDDKEEPAVVTPSRADKRRQRGADLIRTEKERGDRLERELAAARHDALEARQVALEARTRPAAKEEADPLKAEEKSLRDQYRALSTRFREAQGREGVTQVELDKLEEEAWDIKSKMDRNTTRQVIREQAPDQRKQQEESSSRDALTQLHARHGDVTRDPRATAYFKANYAKALATGKPDNWQTLDEAMDATRTELRMTPPGGRPAPSQAQRQRLSGMGRGGGGAGSEEKGVAITPEIRRQANIAYAHLPKEKRLQAWVDNSSKYDGEIEPKQRAL